jgi:hypothetical protein
LFFVSNQRLFSVDIQIEPAFTSSNPVRLPIVGFQQYSTWGHQFDMTPDGKQLIMLFPPAQSAAALPTGLRIEVVLNWFRELQERIPVK